MNITFKQGIIKYSQPGTVQTFLQQSTNGVSLLAENASVLINFSHGTSNYIFEEFNNIVDAWIYDFTNSDYWLYWDINPLTGIRTFGVTEFEPLVSSNTPLSASIGQHWYDLSKSKMFIKEQSHWREVIRVFAAGYDGMQFYPMGEGLGKYQYAGTQVGINDINSIAGKILYNDDGKPVLNKVREFYTTESIFNVNGSNIDTLRLESSYIVKIANEPIPKYHVVKFTNDEKISLAQYSDINDSVLGITTENINTLGLGNVIMTGIVTNVDWNWTEEPGHNIWLSKNGDIVTSDPYTINHIDNMVQYQPIGKILSTNSILFNPTYVTQLDTSDAASLTPATVYSVGTVKLSTVPSDPNEPIVVCNTDPRLADDRNPLEHSHIASNITFTSNTELSSLNVRDALDQLNIVKTNMTDPRLADDRYPLEHSHIASDITFVSGSYLLSNTVQSALNELAINSANVNGTVFTGPVVLAGNPITNLSAVTKLYVDKLELSNLVDVDTDINPIDNDILSYNTTLSKWVAVSAKVNTYTFIEPIIENTIGLFDIPHNGLSESLWLLQNVSLSTTGYSTDADNNNANFKFSATDTWAIDYRPTSIDITINVPIGGTFIEFNIIDSNLNVIGTYYHDIIDSNSTIINIPLTFLGYDFNTIDCNIEPNIVYHITDIKFNV